MTHVQPQTQSRSRVTWRSAGLFAVRYGIGAVMVLAGIVMLAIDGGELGCTDWRRRLEPVFL